ncbi:MAG: type II toxin-antitoxin system VapC family toxin [Blastocatellia bacterium]
MVYVLDTHPLIWLVGQSPLLSQAALTAMSDPTALLVVPTMCLVEIQYLAAKNRIIVTPEQIEQRLRDTPNTKIYPLDEEVVSKVPLGLDIHDAIIVATALVYRDIRQQPATLITKDGMVTRSGLIQTLW